MILEMNKLLLLANEAKLIAAMKKGVDVPQAAEEIGITKQAAYFLLRRLVRFGIVRRTGHKKNYHHEVVDKPYEIVKRRNASKTEPKIELDNSLKELMNTHFNSEQFRIYETYKGLDRRVIANHLGMTKAQLNFALINAGLGEDKVCVRRK